MIDPAEAFICAVCGQSHSGLSTDTAFTLPDIVWAIPESEREQHAKWTSDLCQLGERYFIRGLLPINFIDQPGYYGWGIWAESLRVFASRPQTGTRLATPPSCPDDPTVP